WAEIGLDLFDPGGTGLVRGDIPFVDWNAGISFEFLRCCVVTAVVGGDLVSGRLESLRYRFTDSARSARHHRDACHFPSSLRRTVWLDAGRRTQCSCRRPRRVLALVWSHLSTHIAMPMPPPMQRVARPFFALRFCISWSSVTSTRPPDAPIG